MKVVCCKNCGAKYQLDDTDDITTFECSSCAGDLEYLEDYSNEESHAHNSYTEVYRSNNSHIVQCSDCGLKYKIKSSDSILDYECDSCGGPLRYLDEDMNKELDKYIEEKQKEIQEIKKESEKSQEPPEETVPKKPDMSLRSLTGKLGDFFSEEQMQKIAEDEMELAGKQEKTARTTIPESVLNKFGKEFALPKTNDYNILKNFLKDEFLKGMDPYYPRTSESEKSSKKSFIDKLSIAEPDNGEIKPNETSLKEKDAPKSDSDGWDKNEIAVIGGAAIFIVGIVILFVFTTIIAVIALVVGIVLMALGFYKTKNVKETTERTRIIREHLLTLPDEYYVFYNVKTPTANSSINHLVVGPTGIYALLSQRYNPKVRLESENENLSLIRSSELDEDRIEEIEDSKNIRRFRYTTKQAKFSQDNKVKQKALYLGEDLINFLNDNNIRNCFVEPLVGFINNEVVVINMPLTDEDLFIEELLNTIKTSTIKLDQETIEKCAVLINTYSADCSSEV